jgi:hypothetical protein
MIYDYDYDYAIKEAAQMLTRFGLRPFELVRSDRYRLTTWLLVADGGDAIVSMGGGVCGVVITYSVGKRTPTMDPKDPRMD